MDELCLEDVDDSDLGNLLNAGGIISLCILSDLPEGKRVEWVVDELKEIEPLIEKVFETKAIRG